jgi:hypothetical protein
VGPLSAAAAMLPELAVEMQRRFEQLYGLEPHSPVSEYLIPHERAARLPGGGSRTLVTEEEGELALGVVLEGSVGSRLAAQDPRVRLSSGNLDPFCTLAEEVSHFVYLLYCARNDRNTTQLELELVGEVDKYLAATHLLSLQDEGALSSSLRELLFRHYRLSDGLSEEQAHRYHKANHLAERYCAFLERRFLRPLHRAGLEREARRFYRLDQRGKVERISSLT